MKNFWCPKRRLERISPSTPVSPANQSLNRLLYRHLHPLSRAGTIRQFMAAVAVELVPYEREQNQQKQILWLLVLKRTITTERPMLVGEF
jgi:hypothetical protein